MIMDDNSIMPFGKYKGQKLEKIPAWYLLCLLDGGKCYGELLEYLIENEDELLKELQK